MARVRYIFRAQDTFHIWISFDRLLLPLLLAQEYVASLLTLHHIIYSKTVSSYSCFAELIWTGLWATLAEQQVYQTIDFCSAKKKLKLKCKWTWH